MDIKEYCIVKEFTYLEYCDYLQEKYGIGISDYMTKSYNSNPKCKRTKDGLLAHHKKEDTMIMLSDKKHAQMCPFEWQQKENIVYCDYLEHLLLHVLICQYPSVEKIEGYDVGVGGVVNFIVPELNDLYSGWVTNQNWRRNCHAKVLNDKDVYFEILKQFISIKRDDENFDVNLLCRSFNQTFGLWDESQNFYIYDAIESLF